MTHRAQIRFSIHTVVSKAYTTHECLKKKKTMNRYVHKNITSKNKDPKKI